METRANHVLIGSFVLIAVFALLGFVMWLAKVEIDRQYAYYDIVFDTAVSGLSVGGDVRYNGIPVGTVQSIRLDPDDPGKVRVTVEVDGDTPIKTDTEATLELQGVTGVSFIQLTGGTPAAPGLTARPGEERPVIAAKPSAFQELFAGAPELINRITVLVAEFQKLVNDDNRKAIGDILANVASLSDRLAKRGPEIEEIIVNVNQTSSDLSLAITRLVILTEQLGETAEQMSATLQQTDKTLTTADRTLSTADRLLSRDLKALVNEIQGTSSEVTALADELEGLVAENRKPLKAFTEGGLVEFTKFVNEARYLVGSASRLVDDINRDPARFLFGNRQGTFQAK